VVWTPDRCGLSAGSTTRQGHHHQPASEAATTVAQATPTIPAWRTRIRERGGFLSQQPDRTERTHLRPEAHAICDARRSRDADEGPTIRRASPMVEPWHAKALCPPSVWLNLQRMHSTSRKPSTCRLRTIST
jgi:hypothetical protein